MQCTDGCLYGEFLVMLDGEQDLFARVTKTWSNSRVLVLFASD